MFSKQYLNLLLVFLILISLVSFVSLRQHAFTREQNSRFYQGTRHLSRAFPSDALAPTVCQNTVQGRWHMTDDQGRVCLRTESDARTGCCVDGEQFSCETCCLEDYCCSSYEHCVSCCLRPDMRAEELYQVRYRSANRPETDYWRTSFEYCRGICRPNSNTTVHENAYLSDSHFCFSATGKPRSPGPGREILPEGIQVVVGEQGQSCNQVCQGNGLHCSEEHLRLLNNCNWLRDHFGCEAGCQTDSDMQGFELPAYVIAAASKKENPSMCVLNEAKGFGFSCEAKRQSLRRICACQAGV